jgi:hypothetical protein
LNDQRLRRGERIRRGDGIREEAIACQDMKEKTMGCCSLQVKITTFVNSLQPAGKNNYFC